MSRTDVKFKAKEQDVSALFDGEDIVLTPETVLSNGWLPLPEVSTEFPYTGRAVYVTDGVNMAPAVWRVTRSYDGANVKWVYDQYWAQHNAGGQRLAMVPIAYKKMED
jgi:hypothetical protein